MTGDAAMSNKDYYAELELTRSADDAAIKRAYRRLALQFHPAKTDDAGAPEKFVAINEAYDVLSDRQLKAIYDQFGSQGLASGVPINKENGEQGFTAPYSFHKDSMLIFREFFAGDNPFHGLFPPVDEFGITKEIAPRTRKQQNPPLVKDLKITLEEAYLGCVKKMRVQRQVMNDDGHTSMVREKILTIHVASGWKEGTRVTFAKEGDQEPNSIPADIVFVIKYKQHDLYQREGNNLVHTAKISLAHALTGCEVKLKTLDDRYLNVPINDVVCPGYERRVEGEGMPITKAPGTRGDLIIRFETAFPTSLPDERKHLVRQGLA